ncbi:MAG: response regulator transcription factor [Actinomycetia bacterium]|nr:response regulator transcription factor [Actinomycetes bacterium]MCP4962064.1 response regulator transcription factor [Actinomycetes bacterium]
MNHTTSNARIVIAEDDPRQAELIRLYLEREGHSVVVTSNGRQALDEIRRRRPDLALLDIMMPHVDGLDVCRILRYESDLPIIFVTARSTEEDLLLGLDLGADDYLTKPYSPRELVARVRTVLRRSAKRATGPEYLGVGDLRIDPRRHRIDLAGDDVSVTPKEFAVLESLAREPGRAFSRRDLLESAFGFEHDVLERTVDVHVLNLRKKIENDPSEPRYILTVYGVGYAFAEQ